MRKTKIICTIGPVTESEAAIKSLIKGGMNLARLNFSHGTHSQHAQVIRRVRQVANELGMVVGIVQDLCGPKLRVGHLVHSPMTLKRGSTVILKGDSAEVAENTIPVGSPEAIQLLDVGDKVLLDDGKLELKVVRTGKDFVECKVTRGGELLQGKGVNLPSVRMKLPVLTPKDLADLAFGIKHNVDWVAMSFIRCADDVLQLRAEMDKLGRRLPIIAKIEKPQAVDDLDRIIATADGVMVARGDLGVEMPLERVPIIQKQIIEKCSIAGKPVIVATQMLESMIHAGRPTRAEVSDIANAILDGTDACMLSGETAVGEYPFQALEVMDRVARQTEKSLDYSLLLSQRAKLPCDTITDAISQACGEVAYDLQVAAIVTSTASGHTAAMVSRLRPVAPLLAMTPDKQTLNRLTLWWGVIPILVRKTKDTDEMSRIVLQAAKDSGLLKSGDLIVLTAGVPAGIPGHTNLIKVETIA